MKTKVFLAGVPGIHSDSSGHESAFKSLGCDVSLFNYRSRHESEFLDMCSAGSKSDVAVFCKCSHYSTKIVKLCSERVRTVYWYMDPTESLRKTLGVLDKVSICHAAAASRRGPWIEFLKHNPNSHLVHEGFDPVYHRSVSGVAQDIDVSFIGSVGGRRDRARLHKLIGFHVFSSAFGVDHSTAVCRSKINLNFSEGCGTSNRIYKLMAAGGFVLTQWFEGVDEDFRIGRDLEVFRTDDELSSLIAYYLDNPDKRAEIARNGMDAVQKYSWRSWASRILDVAFK